MQVHCLESGGHADSPRGRPEAIFCRRTTDQNNKSAVDTMRAGLKSAFEVLGAALGITQIGRKATRDRIAVLAYHNVVPTEEAGRGDASLHLPLPLFIRQIERLSCTHEIVDLETAASRPPGKRPRAVITFDDAYRGAVSHALPELFRRGLPAVVFVAPGLLGTPITWWDALGEAGRLAEMRATCLRDLAGKTQAILRRAFHDQPLPVLPDSYGIATLEELEQHCHGPVRIGSHTWAHEYLPALSDSELQETLEQAARWLRGYRGPRSAWLALPYGAGSSDQVARVALNLGHAGILRIDGGLWRPNADTAAAPRINVPAGLSWRGVELRASGVFLR